MNNLKDKPEFQEFHIEGIKYISPLDAYELVSKNQAILVDVRNENEIPIVRIDLDNILYYPMDKIIDRLDSLPKEKNLILVCPAGVRSAKVANLLKMQGFLNAATMDGGFDKWIELKLPFKAGLKLQMSGCDCSCESGNSDSNCC